MAPIGAVAVVGTVARHSLLTSVVCASSSRRISSSVWGSRRSLRNLLYSSSETPWIELGQELQGNLSTYSPSFARSLGLCYRNVKIELQTSPNYQLHGTNVPMIPCLLRMSYQSVQDGDK